MLLSDSMAQLMGPMIARSICGAPPSADNDIETNAIDHEDIPRPPPILTDQGIHAMPPAHQARGVQQVTIRSAGQSEPYILPLDATVEEHLASFPRGLRSAVAAAAPAGSAPDRDPGISSDPPCGTGYPLHASPEELAGDLPPVDEDAYITFTANGEDTKIRLGDPMMQIMAPFLLPRGAIARMAGVHPDYPPSKRIHPDREEGARIPPRMAAQPAHAMPPPAVRDPRGPIVFIAAPGQGLGIPIHLDDISPQSVAAALPSLQSAPGEILATVHGVDITRSLLAKNQILDPADFASVTALSCNLAGASEPDISPLPALAIRGECTGSIVQTGYTVRKLHYLAPSTDIIFTGQIWFNVVDRGYDMSTAWISFVQDPTTADIWQKKHDPEILPFYRDVGAPQINFPLAMKPYIGMTIREALQLARIWQSQAGVTTLLMNGIYAVQALAPAIAITFDLAMPFEYVDGYLHLHMLPTDREKLIDITDMMLNSIGRTIGPNRDLLIARAADIYIRCNGVRSRAITPRGGE